MSAMDSFFSVEVPRTSVLSFPRLSQAVKTSDAEAKRAFLELLLEKVFLRDIAMKNTFWSEEDQEEMSLFNVKERNDLTNEIFKNKLAEQLVEIGAFDLATMTETPGEK